MCRRQQHPIASIYPFRHRHPSEPLQSHQHLTLYLKTVSFLVHNQPHVLHVEVLKNAIDIPLHDSIRQIPNVSCERRLGWKRLFGRPLVFATSAAEIPAKQTACDSRRAQGLKIRLDVNHPRFFIVNVHPITANIPQCSATPISLILCKKFIFTCCLYHHNRYDRPCLISRDMRWEILTGRSRVANLPHRLELDLNTGNFSTIVNEEKLF